GARISGKVRRMARRATERDPVTNQFVRKGGSAGNAAGGNSGAPHSVDPVATGAGASEPSEPASASAKRGSGPASGTSSASSAAKAGTSLDLSSLQGVIQGAHAIIAYFDQPHWMMNDSDAKQYAAAWGNALRHF